MHELVGVFSPRSEPVLDIACAAKVKYELLLCLGDIDAVIEQEAVFDTGKETPHRRQQWVIQIMANFYMATLLQSSGTLQRMFGAV